MNYLKISDEKVKLQTGKTWRQWFAIMDKFGAKKRGHSYTAKYLKEKYFLKSWWAQVITIRYEKEKGYWTKCGK